MELTASLPRLDDIGLGIRLDEPEVLAPSIGEEVVDSADAGFFPDDDPGLGIRLGEPPTLEEGPVDSAGDDFFPPGETGSGVREEPRLVEGALGLERLRVDPRIPVAGAREPGGEERPGAAPRPRSLELDEDGTLDLATFDDFAVERLDP